MPNAMIAGIPTSRFYDKNRQIYKELVLYIVEGKLLAVFGSQTIIAS